MNLLNIFNILISRYVDDSFELERPTIFTDVKHKVLKIHNTIEIVVPMIELVNSLVSVFNPYKKPLQ